MDLQLDEEFAWRLLISFIIGTAIGFEREYRSKAAGLRTMIMICLGSTIFTELSMLISPSTPDRIASNIITGIGFLGAGVIFKDGLTITGITTATTIWIASALGMAVGAGQYFMALFGMVGVLIVLGVFEKFQYLVDRMHQTRSYKITFNKNKVVVEHMEALAEKLHLGFRKRREQKELDYIIIFYEVSGKERKLDEFNHRLRSDEHVVAFEY
jgi:putative Mg2+ transporter-C (MgtC) family protein